MSWIERVSPIRVPAHPGGAFASPIFYSSAAPSLACYSFGGLRTIAATFGYSVVVASTACVPNNVSYGGYMGFTSGTYNVWYDATYGWVLANQSSTPINAPIYELWSGSAYVGMAFYTIGTGTGTGSFPSWGATPTAYGRGSLRGSTLGGTSSTTLAVSTTWEYWQLASGSYGEFAAQGTASGTKICGLPQWTADSVDYIRSLNTTDGTHYSYGTVAWDATASKYILGSYGSDDGWNENADAPTAGDDWTLTFAKPSGSSATGDDIVLTWDAYVKGSNSASQYGMSANIWRS